MSTEKVRPSVVVVGGDSFTIYGTDPEGIHDMEHVDAPEDMVRIVWDAIRKGGVLWTEAGKWLTFNPATVLWVQCAPFD